MAGYMMHREALKVILVKAKKEPRAWPVQWNGAWCDHATFGFPLLSLS